MHSGVANLPLHPGKAPRWLFQRMERLASAMSEIMVDELGRSGFLDRISDPFWFQAFSCVLGFDWHSSGTTTVTGGALKSALNKKELGILVAGGKGSASRMTQLEIEDGSMKMDIGTNAMEDLGFASRMTAKVDSAAVQDGHDLYYHILLFTRDGDWGVVQQGMNSDTSYARRYHWRKDDFQSFVNAPHNGICGQRQNSPVLDLTSRASEETRKCTLDLVNEMDLVRKDIDKLVNLCRTQPKKSTALQRSLEFFDDQDPSGKELDIFIEKGDVLNMPRTINWGALKKAYELKPTDYQDVLGMEGIGPATVRALSLVSELMYGAAPSWRDPVKYSFAVGGKDGVPYPVNKRVYDSTVDVLEAGIERSKLDNKEKLSALKRLTKVAPRALV